MKFFYKESLKDKFLVGKFTWSFVLSLTVSFIALQIPVFNMAGQEGQAFTLFDFVAPALAGLWGVAGIVGVVAVRLLDMFVASDFSQFQWLRLFPVFFGALYFYYRKPWSVVVSLLCMAAWIAHPIGREAWTYSLFWLIPSLMSFLSVKNVLTTAVGATFTQHAVGGVAFLYAFGYSAEFWIGLIPIVPIERGQIAVGMAVFYVVGQLVVQALGERKSQYIALKPATDVLMVGSK